MMKVPFLVFCLWIGTIWGSVSPQDVIEITYQRMDETDFNEFVVGNTILGSSPHSHSLYMIFFDVEGICRLWKQEQIYEGKWWIEWDEHERDVVRAHWFKYTSSDPRSIFYPGNPHYGTGTSVLYYRNLQRPNMLILVKNESTIPLLLVPGCAFPKYRENKND